MFVSKLRSTLRSYHLPLFNNNNDNNDNSEIPSMELLTPSLSSPSSSSSSFVSLQSFPGHRGSSNSKNHKQHRKDGGIDDIENGGIDDSKNVSLLLNNRPKSSKSLSFRIKSRERHLLLQNKKDGLLTESSSIQHHRHLPSGVARGIPQQSNSNHQQLPNYSYQPFVNEENNYSTILDNIHSIGYDDGDFYSHIEYRYPAMVEKSPSFFGQLLTLNLHPTLVYFLVFWSFGICVGFLGPTLWDLGCQTGTTLPTMTWVFFSQSLFITIGTMISGLLINQFACFYYSTSLVTCSLKYLFGPHAILLSGMIGITLTFVAITVSHSIHVLTLVLAIMGLAMGIIDTTANVSMLKLYGSNVTPFLQALHFFYGTGAFLSPLIAEPFLRNFDCSILVDNTTIPGAGTSSAGQDANGFHIHMPRSLEEAQSKIKVHEAFLILAALQVPIIFCVLSLMYKEKIKGAGVGGDVDMSHDEKPKKHATTGFNAKEYEQLDDPKPLPTTETMFEDCWVSKSPVFIVTVILGALLLFFADGLQADFGGLVFSYGKLSIPGLESSAAAQIDASFWGTFALGRFIAIFAALYVSPAVIIFLDVVRCLFTFSSLQTAETGAMIAMILMALMPESETFLYLSIILFGLFLSSIAPSTISLCEQFLQIGPSATSLVVVGGAIGEMVYPVVIGHLFNTYGAMSFVISGLLTCGLMIVNFICLAAGGLIFKGHQPTKDFVQKHLGFCCCCFRCCSCCSGMDLDGDEPTEDRPILNKK